MKVSATSFVRLLTGLISLAAATGSLSAAPTASFPQPQPSDREQYLLELINAARANPAGEGQMLAGITDSEILRYYSYYKVDLGQVTAAFNGYAAKPPLAFNAALMASAAEQSAYQASAGVQTHNSADGTTFDKRITAAGYQWSGLGENVYAYAEDPFFGHVGLIVDWGVPDIDHRANLMNLDANVPTFREIGISCADSSIKDFGPLVITEDFGAPQDSSVAYVTGVIYQDNNGNGAYDEGEGLAGVTVTPDAGTYYATTGAAGGFVIPLPASGSGTLTITAAGGGLGTARVKTINYTAGTNVKVDFTTADATSSLPTVTVAAPSKDAVPSTQVGEFVVSRTGDLSQALLVTLDYGGTAVNGVDCTTLPTSVTIPAGQSSTQLNVQPTDAERSEVLKLKMTLQPTGNYQIVTSNAKLVKARVRIWPAP